MNEVLWDEDFDVMDQLDQDDDYQLWLDSLDHQRYDVEWYHVTETTHSADILWGIRDAC